MGKFRDGKIHPIPGHSMPLATIGVFVLGLGWFGFNPGSTMAADPEAIARICITTNSAAAAGLLASTIAGGSPLGNRISA
jgi:Amt family ammonium transporter